MMKFYFEIKKKDSFKNIYLLFFSKLLVCQSFSFENIYKYIAINLDANYNLIIDRDLVYKLFFVNRIYIYFAKQEKEQVFKFDKISH